MLKFFKRHEKIILVILALAFIGLFLLGYSLTVTKEIEPLISPIN